MMHMSFWFGYDNVQMIFDKWVINDIPNLIGSCSGLFMIGIIYEFIKTWREEDFWRIEIILQKVVNFWMIYG